MFTVSSFELWLKKKPQTWIVLQTWEHNMKALPYLISPKMHLPESFITDKSQLQKLREKVLKTSARSITTSDNCTTHKLRNTAETKMN